MESEIYKPFVYNDAGIYKVGAEGGGGGGGKKYTQFTGVYFSSTVTINLYSPISKNNLCILCSFVKDMNSYNVIRLLNGSTANFWLRISSNGSLYTDNNDATWGDALAINTPLQSVIVREDYYRRIENSGVTQYPCPYSLNSFNKIELHHNILRVAFYNGTIDEFENDNKIIDLRPMKKNGQSGMEDIVNGVFYNFNCNIYP